MANYWTNHEERSVRTLYPTASRAEVERAIPRHSWAAIARRARHLHVTRETPHAKKSRMTIRLFNAREAERVRLVARANGVVRLTGDETHDWHVPSFTTHECCRRCGIIRRADRRNGHCRGVVGVGPRGVGLLLGPT